MSGELRDLYQEVILDHSRRPRNFGEPAGANRRADGYNPLCGDRETVVIRLEDDRLEDVGFRGAGCAISTASASLMTVAAKGLTREQALELFGHVHTMLTVDPEPGGDEPQVGKLAALSGVREYPTRVKCASLAWQTLRSALTAGPDPTAPTTE